MHIKIMEMGREYVCRERNMPVLGGFMSPVSDAYSKKNLANWRDRVEMCRLAAASTSDWIAVDAWEAQQPAWTPTTRVMESIHDRLLSFYGVSSAVIKMFLVVGSDLLEGMKKSNLWSDSQVNSRSKMSKSITIIQSLGIKFI